MDKSCKTCVYRLRLEKLDYSNGGCKHTPMDGFICLGLQDEGLASWMVGISDCEQCEMYSPKE